MGLGPLRPIRWITERLFRKVLQQDIDVLDKAWRGITAQGLPPEELECRDQDLAWPWLKQWMGRNPPEPGQSFEGAVKA
jgi:hypothetical protein